MQNVIEGQVWKQGQGTPREGDEALWVIKGFPVVNTKYVNMECLGTNETKRISVHTLKTHYKLIEDGALAKECDRMCYDLNSATNVDNEVMNGTFLSRDDSISPEELWERDDKKLTYLTAANRRGKNMFYWYLGTQVHRARNDCYPENTPKTAEEFANYRAVSPFTIYKAVKVFKFFDFKDYKGFSILPQRALYKVTMLDDYSKATQLLEKWVCLYEKGDITQKDMLRELDNIRDVGSTYSEDSNETERTYSECSSNMVDIYGYAVPRSNIYPKLFAGEYIINPNFLVVYEDKCYGFDEWEPAVVIDGLVDRMRGGVSKGDWFDEHLDDIVEVFDVDKEEQIASYSMIACFPTMSPPTVDEAMEMARNHKRVVNRAGDEGTIIGVHGKSEDRDVLFLVRFDGEYPGYPEVDSEIKPMWYHQLVERWLD